MAIAIKSIPVLEGNAAKRFDMMIDAHHNKTITIVPEEMRKSIAEMMERSRNFKLKEKK